MSLKIDNIQAYNVKLKRKERMKVTDVIKTPITTKEGKKTGKFRYRLAGVGTDGTGMSRFIGEKDAKSIARQLGKSIEERAVKSGNRRKTCKQIGYGAYNRCADRRGETKKVYKKKKRGRK